MEETQTREFTRGRHLVTVQETTGGRYTLTWGHRRKSGLKGPRASAAIISILRNGLFPGRAPIRFFILGMEMKAVGVDWIALSIASGVRPLILRAPALYRDSLLYIEPTDTPGRFTMRVVNPMTEHRTNPVEVSRAVVEAAVKTFG